MPTIVITSAKTGERVEREMTPEEIAAMTKPVTRSCVNAERNRRLKSGITFNGILYQSLDEDIKRITGAATLAGFAVGAGSPVGNLRWANPGQDFGWIAMDNSVTPMDAQTMFAFGQAAAARESAHVFAARTLKNMDPIPVDFADDKWWP